MFKNKTFLYKGEKLSHTSSEPNLHKTNKSNKNKINMLTDQK